MNNPLNAVDPHGKDVYLEICATTDRNAGHASLAVSNYDKNNKATGTYTHYDLWPGTQVDKDNFAHDAGGNYQVLPNVAVDDLKNTDVSGGEKGIAPDGIVW